MIYKLNCVICKKEFQATAATKKTCSEVCHKSRLSVSFGRFAKVNIATGSVGAMSELFVAGELLKKGYSVFRSLSSSCYCDLIAQKEDKTFNVEVRTGYINPRTGSLLWAKRKRGNVNCFAIYERNSGEITYLDGDYKKINL